MTSVWTRIGAIDLDAPVIVPGHLPAIAGWMATKPRWNAHLVRPVSVAEHSLAVASLAPKRVKLAAVLHDAHEFVIGDLLRPVERALEPRIGHGPIDDLRGRLDRAIVRACGIADDEAVVACAMAMRSLEVRAADDAACAFEQKYCTQHLTDWPEDALYPREAPDPYEVATRWLAQVRLWSDVARGGGAA